MTTVTARVNHVLLNRGADLWFMGENACLPFGNFAAKDVPAALDRLGADAVVVEYRTVTDPKAREQDRKKYTRRLAGLGEGWVVDEWSNKVIDGFVFENTMQCVLKRRP